MVKWLNGLFEELIGLTGIEDIGYHRIDDDRLIPVAKSTGGMLLEKDWIEQHKKNPVIVSEDMQLVELMATKKVVYIKDCEVNSTKALDYFSVHSMYTYPVIEHDEVVGIVVMVSIGKKNELSDEVIEQCEKVINEFLN